VSPVELGVCLAAVSVAFVVSASAGLGGSLVLVPALALVLGTKEGAALAAVLLGANNVVKVIAYLATIPWRKAAWIGGATIVGAALGAWMLVATPERVVSAAVVAGFITALVFERVHLAAVRRRSAPVFALGAGMTSGFSGTSGPLKGVAVRALSLDRTYTVGAASLVSLAGDATKSAVYSETNLLGDAAWRIAVAAIPLMISATLLGRRLNRRAGERGYSVLFWGVMMGYTWRLVASF